jgi:hypothetical protein
VHRFGVLQTALLIVLACATTFLGLVYGLLWLALIAGALAALSGWMTSAWRLERPWSWWAWSIPSGFGLLTSLAGVLGTGPSWGSVSGLVINGVLLVLLAHPWSRRRIEPVATLPGDGGVGGPVAPRLHWSGD